MWILLRILSFFDWQHMTDSTLLTAPSSSMQDWIWAYPELNVGDFDLEIFNMQRIMRGLVDRGSSCASLVGEGIPRHLIYGTYEWIPGILIPGFWIPGMTMWPWVLFGHTWSLNWGILTHPGDWLGKILASNCEPRDLNPRVWAVGRRTPRFAFFNPRD